MGKVFPNATGEMSSECSGEEDDTESCVGVTEVNTSDTTEAEGDTELDDRGQTEKVYVTRKSFDGLVSTNKTLRKLVEEKHSKLEELQRNHSVIQDENQVLTLEIRDISRKAQMDRVELERQGRMNAILTRRVEILRSGMQELNGRLIGILGELRDTGNGVTVTTSTSLVSKLIQVEQENKETQQQPPPPKQKMIMDGSSGGQTQAVVPKVVAPVRRSIRSHSSVAKQISACLEKQMPALPPVPRPTLAVQQDKMVAKRKPKRTTDPVYHAEDLQKQHLGYFCICGVSVTSRVGLKFHIQYYTYQPQFRCTVKSCGKRVLTTSMLRGHMKGQHGLEYKKSNGCRRCGETFESRMKLYIHCKNVHDCGPLVNRRAPCTVISIPTPAWIPPETDPKPKGSRIRRGRQKAAVKRHYPDNTKSVHIHGFCRCLCGRQFRLERELRVHLRYFWVTPKFPCEFCGKRFKGTNYLRQHTKHVHRMEYNGGFGCRTCGQLFQFRLDLHQHQKNSHQLKALEIPFSTPPASIQRTSSGESLPKRVRKIPVKYRDEFADNRHLKTKNVASFKCAYCPLKFPRRGLLWNHNQTSHQSMLTFDSMQKSAKNLQKPASLSSSGYLAIEASPDHNVASINEQTNEFKCVCGSVFTRKETLREHIRLKLKLTKFECNICRETFSRHDYLKLHLQRKHNQLLTGFACRICGCGGFKTSNDVKLHHASCHDKEGRNRDPLFALRYRDAEK